MRDALDIYQSRHRVDNLGPRDHVFDVTNGLLQAFTNGSVALVVPSQIANSIVEVIRLEGVQVCNPRGLRGYVR